MKHGNSNYLQLTRSIFTEKYKTLSNNAKWLFVVLNELEQRYTGDEKDYFFRSNEELAEDCGFSLAGLKRAKAQNRPTDQRLKFDPVYIRIGLSYIRFSK